MGVWRTPEAGLDRRGGTMHIAGNTMTGGFARKWLAVMADRGEDGSMQRAHDSDAGNMVDGAPHPLDAATHLTWTGDGFTGLMTRAYWNFAGPYGGLTAALLMRALMQHPERRGDPIALTVNYYATIAEGPLRISLRAARTNRSTQHWFLELAQGDDAPAITATAICSARPETWSHRPAQPPSLPPEAELVRFPWEKSPCAWMARYDVRLDRYTPLAPRPLAEPVAGAQTGLMRDEPPRPLDFVSLAAFADCFFARVFVARGTLMPVGTISMTTWFHATADALARQGEAPLIGHADTRVYNHGYHDQSAELWSRDGTLLATSHQLVYFRDPPVHPA